MTLSGRVAPDRLQSFTEFLGQSSDTSYDKVTLDQWTSFLDFCVECEDFADYDEGNSAWPTMIDDYVEYVEHMQRWSFLESGDGKKWGRKEVDSTFDAPCTAKTTIQSRTEIEFLVECCFTLLNYMKERIDVSGTK